MYHTIEKWVCLLYSKLNGDAVREAITNIVLASKERKLKMRYLKNLSYRSLIALAL